MTTPLFETITTSLTAAINTITIANGYRQDLVAARPKTIDFSDVAPADGVVIIMHNGVERAPDGAAMMDEWLLDYVLFALALGSADSSNSYEEKCHNIFADINAKLKEDVNLGHADHVVDTVVGGYQVLNTDDGYSGIVIAVTVHCRHLFGAD
jgi:hypothetical protein